MLLSRGVQTAKLKMVSYLNVHRDEIVEPSSVNFVHHITFRFQNFDKVVDSCGEIATNRQFF